MPYSGSYWLVEVLGIAPQEADLMISGLFFLWLIVMVLWFYILEPWLRGRKHADL